MKQSVTFILLCSIITLSGFTAIAEKANNKGWKAGVSSVVITPKQPMWMAGYANRDRPSEGKLVDLWAKALALEDENGKQLVIVTADLVGIPKELSNHIRDQMESKFRLTRSQVIINTSHTHTGRLLTNALTDIYPVNADQQQKIDQHTMQLGGQIILLVGKAIASLQQADVYSGNGVTRFQVNRRNNVEACWGCFLYLNPADPKRLFLQSLQGWSRS
jgi:hypothetical protein